MWKLLLCASGLFGIATLVGFSEKRCRKNLPVSIASLFWLRTMNTYDAPADSNLVSLKSGSSMPGWFSPAMALSSLAMLLVSIGMVYWSGDTEPFFGHLIFRLQ